MSVHGLGMVGLSHRTAGIELRERLAVPKEGLGTLFARLRAAHPSAEALLLSTCNRVELYVASDPPLEGPLTGLLASLQEVDPQPLQPHAFEMSGAEAVRHCFEVAAGLDALALGETQILAQVKEAYCLALEHRMTGPLLNALFQQAFATAKRVHTETTIGQRKTSVSSVAVDLAGRIFQDLSDRTALVIGAGEMSELTVTHLVEAGLKHLLVANRTLVNAEALAKPRGGTALPLEALAEALPKADIVISSAGAEGFLVTPAMVREALRQRRQRPLFFIDIAVPRNVHPEVASLDNVYAYDIDDLEKVVEGNLKGRAEELHACRAIVDEAVHDFLQARAVRGDLQPLITALRDRFHALKAQELERLAPEARPAAAEALHRLVNKLLHDPIEVLKAEAAEGNGSDTAEALRKLFKL